MIHHRCQRATFHFKASLPTQWEPQQLKPVWGIMQVSESPSSIRPSPGRYLSRCAALESAQQNYTCEQQDITASTTSAPTARYGTTSHRTIRAKYSLCMTTLFYHCLLPSCFNRLFHHSVWPPCFTSLFYHSDSPLWFTIVICHPVVPLTLRNPGMQALGSWARQVKASLGKSRQVGYSWLTLTPGIRT